MADTGETEAIAERFGPLIEGVAARAAEADRAGRLPDDDVAELARHRFPALAAPRELGGEGATLATCATALLELARASGSTALVAGMTLHIVGNEREQRGWPDPAWEAIASDVAAGALLNSAASEPALGSPSRGGLPETRAEAGGEGFALFGRKTWVTGGAQLSHLLVRARLERPGHEPAAGTVWLPAATPGVRWERTWGDGLALRASDSDDLILEGARVPEEHLIEPPGLAKAPNVWFPLLMAGLYLGVAIGARDAAIRYALERTPTALGRPIATLPKIQRQLGEIDVALLGARALLRETAARWRGDPAEAEAFLPRAAAAKHLAVESAIAATERALRLVGAAGLDTALPLERAWRDVRGGLMHPPSGDAALELVGRGALGQDG